VCSEHVVALNRRETSTAGMAELLVTGDLLDEDAHYSTAA
jgi:hypothetical protein